MRTMKLLLLAALALSSVACPSTAPRWKLEEISARVGTVVDVHGNTGLSALPAPCQSPTPAFPALPRDWWNGLQARERTGVAVVGYEVWEDTDPTHASPVCPRSFRTDTYRAFFEIDLSRYLPPAAASNQSGTIARAVLVATRRYVFPVMTPAALAQPMTMPSASIWCDPQYGSAFDLRRLPMAVQFASGMTVNILTTPALISNPPIPTAYPTGTRLYAFPTKDPKLSAGATQPVEIDITQDVVSALQQNASKMIFTITGTTEPQIGVGGAVQRRNAPQAQSDCRATFDLALRVSTP